MSATITFTPRNDGEFFTLAEINALFTALAAVINDKIDLDAEVAQDVVTDPSTDVLVGTAQVVVTKGAAPLFSDLGINFQQIINVVAGVHPGDSVQVLQALQLLGIA